MLDSVFTDLARFIPMQNVQDATALARFNDARQNLKTAGKEAEKEKKALYDERLKKACTEFEAIFIKQMLDAMRKTVDRSNDIIKQTMADNIYQDMLYDEYSRKMAKTGHFGIAEMMYNQFTQKTIQPQ